MNELNEIPIQGKLSGAVEADAAVLAELFRNDSTLIRRDLVGGSGMDVCCVLFHLDGMTSSLLITESVLTPLEAYLADCNHAVNAQVLVSCVLTGSEMRIGETWADVVAAMLNGDAILLAEGGAVIVGAKGWLKRAITEPVNERVVRGPRESFIESAMVNLSLLRRKLQTSTLAIERVTFGALTQPRTYLCYLDGRVDPKILTTLKKRLESIELDGVLDSNYLLEQIRDTPASPFKTIGVTERPDVVAAKLLEGRIAVIVDGTPCVLTLPYLFIENFQTNDDYYTNYLYATINRILRMVGFFLTVSVPSVYVAIITYHHEILPPALLLSISASRQGVPFPSIVEMFILLIAFEILREASMRMPSNIGQALSIVGALVLGQAAVEAKLVSAPMVIVIALTGTTSLLTPAMGGAEIITRMGLLLTGATFGMVGFTLGFLVLIFHLASVKTFGVPYLSLIPDRRERQKHDTFVRARWGRLRGRDLFGTAADSEEEHLWERK
ncbi:MAG: spore germination protein [Clostridia bacterium]|nr:spore germination protein [Clostridia bacterium]